MPQDYQKSKSFVKFVKELDEQADNSWNEVMTAFHEYKQDFISADDIRLAYKMGYRPETFSFKSNLPRSIIKLVEVIKMDLNKETL